jgi:hypothetical protein
MRSVVGPVVLGLAFGGVLAARADGDPPVPADGSDWRAEVASLEARAARARSENRLEEARERRAAAVELAGSGGGDGTELAAALNRLALTLGSLGRATKAVALLEESLGGWRRFLPGDPPMWQRA